MKIIRYQIGNVRSLNFKRSGVSKQLKPFLSNSGYLVVCLYYEGKRSRPYPIHVLVAMCFLNHIPDGHNLVVDHKNNNSLDNNLNNLQIVTNRENCLKDRKRVLPRGVCFYKKTGKYKAAIGFQNKVIHLGYYNTPDEASKAYQQYIYKNIQ